MNTHSEEPATFGDEFNGFSESESSETANSGKSTIDDKLEALLESNRLLQQILLNQITRKWKVYIPMPEKFDEKIDDFIEA